MLKLRLTVGLALIAGALTALIGLIQDVRPLTVLYRCLTSMLIFGIGGFALGVMAEGFINNLLAAIKPKGQKIDIINRDELINVDELIGQPRPDNEFSPFTPDNFDRVSGNEQ